MTQPVLYDGDEILKTHHVPVSVPSSKEDLELAELTKQKMNDPKCVKKRIKFLPPNYSKENFLATFTSQTQPTHEQVFWSTDLLKKRAEALKANASPLPVLPPATVYPPNTPVHLVPRTLPTTSQVNIEHFDEVQKSLVTEVRDMKAVFENMEAEVDQNAIDKKSGEIEPENSKLLEKIQNDDHDTIVTNFSKLEIVYLNLQLKHQHLKENVENFKSKPSKDVLVFDAFFEIGNRDAQIQSHKNTIRKLKAQISDLKANKSDVHNNLDYKSLDSQNSHLKETVTALQERLENF
ncbi:hypothetical protein Tco_0660425 [Tanacetum coccineum]